METIIYNVWDIIDSLVQIGIYLAIVKGLARVVRALKDINYTIKEINERA